MLAHLARSGCKTRLCPGLVYRHGKLEASMKMPNKFHAVFDKSYTVLGAGVSCQIHADDLVFDISTDAGHIALDRLIDWKMGSIATARKFRTASTAEEDKPHMMRQFTIELRVNYADNDKNDVMRSSCAAAARHMYATAGLLADGVKPDIAIYSDDWFSGRQDIELLEDVIAKGLAETAGTAPEDEGAISSEMMDALKSGLT